jgi:hypothetical protein
MITAVVDDAAVELHRIREPGKTNAARAAKLTIYICDCKNEDCY